MRTSQRLQFLAFLLVAVVINHTTTCRAQTTDEQQQSSSSTQCPLCVGGEEPNLTKTIGGAPDGPPCSSLVSDVQLDTEGCLELQILGYRWCDCPTYPKENYCTMCENAFHDIPNRFKEIPGTDGGEVTTCDQLLFVKKTEEQTKATTGANGDEVCDEAMKPGYICGCPNAEEPNCTICGGTIDDDMKMTNKDATITLSNSDGEGEVTCQEAASRAVLGTLTVEQCESVQNIADITSICGCVNNNNNNSTTGGGGLGREESISNNTATSPEEEEGGSDSDPAASSSDVPIETDSTITEGGDGNSSSAGTRASSSLMAVLVGSWIMMVALSSSPN